MPKKQSAGSSQATQHIVGERIREQRKRRGLTQERLAEVAELDRKHIGTIESGKTEPRIGTLVRIAGALDIRIEELVADLVFTPSEHSAGRLGLRPT